MKITGLALLTRQDINSYTLLTTYYTLLVTYYTLLVTYYLATHVFSYGFFVKFDVKIN